MGQYRTALVGALLALVLTAGPAGPGWRSAAAAGAEQAAESATDQVEAFLAQLRRLDPPGETAAGAYLAGRFAARRYEYDAAAGYFLATLSHDPDNTALIREAFTMALRGGRLDDAALLAERVATAYPTNRLAPLVLVVDAVRQEAFSLARERLAGLSHDGIGRVASPLISAWVYQGAGDHQRAMAALDIVSADEGTASLAALHRGLILDLSGDAEGAARAFQSAREDGLTLRLALAAGSLYQRQGERDSAGDIYEQFLLENPGSILLGQAVAGMADGARPEPLVQSPADGIAEVLFQLASAVSGEADGEATLLYGHISLALRPDFDLMRLILGDVLLDYGRSGVALDLLSAMDLESPVGWQGRLRSVDALSDLGQDDDAIELLEVLTDRRPDLPEGWVRKGDILRSVRRFDEAVVAYDRGYEQAPDRVQEDWSFYYRRGIALERSRIWDRAEIDLTRAIDLNPDHAHLLNYLGYSWVDRGEQLDEAEALILRAVDLRPNDGYIVDSLGWVYFRTGRYEEAVETLERAIALRPDDAVINDHLGDAYWIVGRHREARFQWQRALRTADEPDMVTAIEDKLVNGLVEPTATAAGPSAEADGE